ncbi:extracellular matrix regulator RemB [Bacillus sp. USDA818B3_A]|uniref:extracellular matrix regulator RemB n=1 Tax=Bacillus sp. USDA818B3_A TaxID=2698834 RepID=UPI00136BC77A|nr:extracellular matrix/biofilm biosynthesis regulator RemA family protein [Bacillus sp. USDA818B3_A]
MYIHIGEDLNIRAKDIVSILDKESALQSPLVEEFLNRQTDRVVNLSKNPYKSVIITHEKIYLSPIASGTLKKRSNQMNIHEL